MTDLIGATPDAGLVGLSSPGEPPALTAWQRATRRIQEDPAVSWIASLTITAMAFLFRLWHLGTPHVFEFDETYYAKDAWSMLHYGYARNYVDNANDHILAGHTANQWLASPEMIVHPDVGKWLIAIGESIWGMDPFGWRIVSAVIGSLMILLMIRFVRRITGSSLLGCFAGLLLTFDGLEFVLSRLALLDIYEAFFVLASVHTMLIDRDWYRARMAARVPDQITSGWGPVKGFLFRPWLLLAGVMWGLACGTKWDAMYPLAGFALMYVLGWCAGARRSFGVRWSVPKAVIADGIPAFLHLVVVCIIVYTATWTGWLMHARQFENSLSSTQYTQYTGHGHCGGDNNQTYISDDPNTNAKWPSAKEAPKTGLGSIPQNLSALLSYHKDVYTFHTHFLNCATHTYASKPSGWLLLNRPVGVAADTGLANPSVAQSGDTPDAACPASAGSSKSGGGCLTQVLLLGTPTLWWGCDIAVIACVGLWLGARDWRAGVVIMGVASTWLPWLQYASRPIFSYYSITTLPFMILGAVLCLGRLMGSGHRRRRTAGVVVGGAFLVLEIANFGWFWPIYTNQLMTHSAWLERIWFSRWI